MATEIPDVKLENLLRLTRDPGSSVVLADFGTAKILDSSNVMDKIVWYTPGYKAPEVIQKKGQGKATDMWCLGVVTYMLLCGVSPFEGDNDADIYEKCISGCFTFDERYWGGGSARMRNCSLWNSSNRIPKTALLAK